MSSTAESVYPRYKATEIKNWSWLRLPDVYFFVLKGVTQFGIAISLVGCGREDSRPSTIEAVAAQANDSGSPAAVGSPRPHSGDSPASRADITISPETTFVTEPVTKGGAIDIVAAINAKCGVEVTPEQNAAVLLYQAIGPKPDGVRQPDVFFERMGISAPPEGGNYFTDLGMYLKQTEGIERNDTRMKQALEEQTRAMATPWKRAELARIGGWLDANEASLQLVVEATRRPRYFSPVVLQRTEPDGGVAIPERGLLGQLLPGVHIARGLGRALVARAMLHLGDGRTEAAWNDLLAVHRLGRLVGQGPTLIEGLVGFDLDGMASVAIVTLLGHGQADVALLQQIARDLENAPPLSDTAEKVDFVERLTFIDSALLAAAGGQQAEEALAVENADAIVRILHLPWFPALDWNVALRTGNQWYDRLAAAMREKEYSRRTAALAAINEDLKKLGKAIGDQAWVQQTLQGKESKAAVSSIVGELLVALLLPAPSVAQRAEDRAVQQRRNLRVALALARFHGEHARYPEQLTELVPEHLPELPPDLFSGQPLKYAQIDQGYLLYSIGPNGEDDGGRDRDFQPPGDDITVKIAGYK